MTESEKWADFLSMVDGHEPKHCWDAYIDAHGHDIYEGRKFTRDDVNRWSENGLILCAFSLSYKTYTPHYQIVIHNRKPIFA